MSVRTILAFVLAGVFGVSAAVYFSATLGNRAAAPTETKAETTPVVIAALDIRTGTKLTREMLRTRDLPRDAVPAGALTRVEDAVDRAANVPLFKDDFVLEAKLAKGLGDGLAVQIKPGWRGKAITMVGPAASVAGGIRPRDRVDVTCIADKLQEDERGGVKTILQNIEVVRVDNRVEAATAEDGKTEQREVRTVTLHVEPLQAAMLDLAERFGKLSLHLRSAGDDVETSAPPVVTLKDLGFAPPVQKVSSAPETVKPAAAETKTPAIRVIRSNAEGSVNVN